ncbi:MAG: hypothetical protein WD577_05440 [Bacteroidales bacterium]
MAHQQKFSQINLSDITQQHHAISADYHDRASIDTTFNEYLQYGYYPFFKEGIDLYGQKLMETTNLVLDVVIAPFEDLSYATVRNMKKLLYIISQSAPFTPNITKISERLNAPRNSILKILDLLAHARIISLLKRETKGMSYLQKPEIIPVFCYDNVTTGIKCSIVLKTIFKIADLWIGNGLQHPRFKI